MLAPDMEILFFSGFDDFEYVRNALLLRAVNYILKPVNPEEFQQIINDILNQLDSRIITFKKSVTYYNESFYDHPVPDEQAGPDTGRESTSWTDQKLMDDISLAISLKRPDQVTALVEELLLRCSDSTSHSPIYIRHTAITLLQLIMTAAISGATAFRSLCRSPSACCVL